MSHSLTGQSQESANAAGDTLCTSCTVHSDATKLHSSELKRSGSSQKVACPTFG
jgi:hypothetical protein